MLVWRCRLLVEFLPKCRLFAFFVTLPFVLLHNGPSGHFLGPLTVAPRLLSAFLDVLVLALLFAADSSQMFLTWHFGLLSGLLGSADSPLLSRLAAQLISTVITSSLALPLPVMMIV